MSNPRPIPIRDIRSLEQKVIELRASLAAAEAERDALDVALVDATDTAESRIRELEARAVKAERERDEARNSLAAAIAAGAMVTDVARLEQGCANAAEAERDAALRKLAELAKNVEHHVISGILCPCGAQVADGEQRWVCSGSRDTWCGTCQRIIAALIAAAAAAKEASDARD